MRRLAFALLILTAVAANAQMVVPRNASSAILIPAAGSLQGANGTYFRSDVTLLNYRNSTQRVQLQWLPEGVTGAGIAPVLLDVSPHSGVNSEDFVATILHQTGIGAIVITGITSDTGASDPNAQLVATSRIWTPLPNSASGTSSEQFNGIPISDINSGGLTLIGHRRDDRYRTNVGVVNLSNQTQSFRIDTLSSTGVETQTIQVLAFSMQQTSLNGPASTLPLQILVTNVSGGTTAWLAYGSSIDNVTGDAWGTFGYNQPAANP